jgi:hypothetical protein
VGDTDILLVEFGLLSDVWLDEAYTDDPLNLINLT